MTCAFFGHHDCPSSIKPQLYGAIKTQIEKGTTTFYVGNHGAFDRLVLSCLRELKKTYKEIDYAVVLAYLPSNATEYLANETVFPEGIEKTPKRFAIDFCNRWMIGHADTIIAYINHSWGRAAKYVKIANNKGIIVINLADN
ncbi:MAG: hypothetical protein II867_04185 [Clostridia bacterium]|nr:hypothetical protein [Clostridia bacterium]